MDSRFHRSSRWASQNKQFSTKSGFNNSNKPPHFSSKINHKMGNKRSLISSNWQHIKQLWLDSNSSSKARLIDKYREPKIKPCSKQAIKQVAKVNNKWCPDPQVNRKRTRSKCRLDRTRSSSNFPTSNWMLTNKWSSNIKDKLHSAILSNSSFKGVTIRLNALRYTGNIWPPSITKCTKCANLRCNNKLRNLNHTIKPRTNLNIL